MDHSPTQRKSRVSASAVLALLCVAVLVDRAHAATTVNVGGSSGYNYRTWASTTRVKPWDSLFFKYDPRLHNVLLVSKADFDACRTTAPWAKYSSGKDYIKFSKSGTYYLICGVARHCAAGMKVAVTVKW
ncbi:hypothetical protein R1flu_011462 [Riccia fluitans]|uniref:Phytocyanin domain-containing protein n=1 Tax=Riccia fluitans TaxID=41844 RepID=A0ABD1Z7W2_9MARC